MGPQLVPPYFWPQWNKAVTQPGFVKSNFTIPPVPTGYKRNARDPKTGKAPIPFEYMSSQYSYISTKSSTLIITCGPKSFLYNSSICIRDPNYWPPNKRWTPFCSPNFIGTLKDRLINRYVATGSCIIKKSWNDASGCCYMDADFTIASYVDIQYFLTLSVNMTQLYDSEFS